ncbi:MAG: alpha/beta hydrolase family protein [Luteolibacter sp.]
MIKKAARLCVIGFSLILALNSHAASDLETVAAIGDLTSAPDMYTSDTGSENATVSPGEVKSVFIDGVDYKGKPTRFFAHIGIPKKASSKSQVPAVVLIHGGGGTAMKQYVDKWNGHGYAAIMIATEGQTDQRASGKNAVGKWAKHSAAGPARSGIYGDSKEPITDQFMYHAVASTVLANSLIRSLPEVDENKVGVIGVSWGGIITSTVIGIDDRFAFAVPVYGSGHLFDVENHYGRALVKNELYKKVWDPMVRMDQAKMPTLWFSWPTDNIFPLDAQAKTYRASPAVRMIASKPGMGHGMGAGFNTPEPINFANSVFDGAPWCVQEKLAMTDNNAHVMFSTTKKLDKAILLSTTETGFAGKRKWKETPAKLENNGDGTYTASVVLPENTTAWFINVLSDGVIASSDYQEP